MSTPSSQNAALVIKLILSNITDNNASLGDNLARLPLSAIQHEKAEGLICWFLNEGTKRTNIQAVRTIIMTFDVARARVDPLPAITNIFLNPLLPAESLTFTISAFPEKSPIDYFVDLVNMGDDNSALKAAGILSTYFPFISNSDWTILLSLTDNFEDEEYENQLLRAFFQSKVAETGKCAPCPTWIVNDIKETDIFKRIPDMPSVNDAVSMILNDLVAKNIHVVSKLDAKENHEKVKELLIAQYSISSILDKILMLSDVHSIPVFDDTTIFHEHGPLNTMLSSCTDINHECVKYGGCRMLLCTEYENIDGNGDDIDIMSENQHIYDWFRGSCDFCLIKIMKRHYSVRQPLHHGGWRGCYCSFECMESHLSSHQDSPHPSVIIMIDSIKEQLHSLGIRERK